MDWHWVDLVPIGTLVTVAASAGAIMNKLNRHFKDETESQERNDKAHADIAVEIQVHETRQSAFNSLLGDRVEPKITQREWFEAERDSKE